MDDTLRDPIAENLADVGPDKIQCPDCGEPFEPGHWCRESAEREVMLIRASFQTAVTALYRIRNATILWKKGSETEKIKEVSGFARKALEEIEEFLFKPKDELNGIAPNGSGESGSVPPVPPDSV